MTGTREPVAARETTHERGSDAGDESEHGMNPTDQDTGALHPRVRDFRIW